MNKQTLRVAVVEDNGMARMHLRNHLVRMGFSDIESYSQGRELRSGLSQRRADLLLIDFHLGQHYNGVEVVQEMQQRGLLTPSTSIIFITSDRLPMVVSQIVDVHPDALVLKPYTIGNLQRTIHHCLNVRDVILPALRMMDQKRYADAIHKVDDVLRNKDNRRLRNDLIKLRGRLLLKLQRYNEASELYRSVLKHSENIIWARWGLIQSLFQAGEIEQSEAMLQEMLGQHLTNAKACEWLARIALQQHHYGSAEHYFEQIKDSELSLSATRLKASILQIQHKMDAAIDLLQRYRESNRSITERFSKISMELARCHLAAAEHKEDSERGTDLSTARSLISSAGRRYDDPLVHQSMDYMYSIAAILEGDLENATRILAKKGMEDFTHTEIGTLIDAVKAWQGVGKEHKASEALQYCERKQQTLDDVNELALCELAIEQSERRLGNKRQRSLKFNSQGMALYDQHLAGEAIEYFYQAYILSKDEPAFQINLLQCLVDCKSALHKSVRTLDLLAQLQQQSLTDANQKRLRTLSREIDAQRDTFTAQAPAPILSSTLRA